MKLSMEISNYKPKSIIFKIFYLFHKNSMQFANGELRAQSISDSGGGIMILRKKSQKQNP